MPLQQKLHHLNYRKQEILNGNINNSIFTFSEIYGGIKLKEVNFKRFESKLYSNLFFAGEVLNIDAVTGGFNFQNAWTGGYIVGNAMA